MVSLCFLLTPSCVLLSFPTWGHQMLGSFKSCEHGIMVPRGRLGVLQGLSVHCHAGFSAWPVRKQSRSLQLLGTTTGTSVERGSGMMLWASTVTTYLEAILTTVIVIYVLNCCKHGAEKHSKELVIKKSVHQIKLIFNGLLLTNSLVLRCLKQISWSVSFQKLLSAAVSSSKGLVGSPEQAGLPCGAGEPTDVCYTV